MILMCVRKVEPLRGDWEVHFHFTPLALGVGYLLMLWKFASKLECLVGASLVMRKIG